MSSIGLSTAEIIEPKAPSVQQLDQDPHNLRTNGDANLWLAPKTVGPGAVTVLLFTTDEGITIAVPFTRDELIRIRDAANNILAATPADVETWLDQAAHAWLEAHPGRRSLLASRTEPQCSTPKAIARQRFWTGRKS